MSTTTTETRTKFANGRRSTTHDTRDEAIAALRAQHPDLHVVDDGSRTLAWTDEDTAENDDGSRAIAELTTT